MRSNKISDLKKSLEAVLEIDPEATFEFEDYGSGTTAINIYIDEGTVNKLTQKQLDALEKKHEIYSYDENRFEFFILLS